MENFFLWLYNIGYMDVIKLSIGYGKPMENFFLMHVTNINRIPI